MLRVGRVQRSLSRHGDRPGGALPLQYLPRGQGMPIKPVGAAVREGTVLDQLGVQAAVRRMAEVLEERPEGSGEMAVPDATVSPWITVPTAMSGVRLVMTAPQCARATGAWTVTNEWGGSVRTSP